MIVPADKKKVIFTPHGIKDDKGDILDVEFTPDWNEEQEKVQAVEKT